MQRRECEYFLEYGDTLIIKIIRSASCYAQPSATKQGVVVAWDWSIIVAWLGC